MNNIDEIKFPKGKRHQAGMTVPEDFFAKFQADLEKEIDKIEPQQLTIKPVAKPNWSLRWMSVAACACLLVTVGFFALQNSEQTDASSATSEQIALESEADNELDTEQMILSSFDDLYLYDLYCEMY